LLGLLDSGHSGLLTVFLLSIRIPFHLLVIRFDWLRSHEIGFGHGIDVYSDMLTHEAHTKCVRKAANFEWLASH
jgi:hypothetical protein